MCVGNFPREIKKQFCAILCFLKVRMQVRVATRRYAAISGTDTEFLSDEPTLQEWPRI
jgi:hypothetical protein